jgi:anti-sigma factor RsiW
VDCHEVEGLLGAYMDEELDPIHSAETEQHLRECAACGGILRRQEALRTAVVTHAAYYPAPDRLRKRLAKPAAAPGQWWMVAAAVAFAAAAFWVVGPTLLGPRSQGLEREVVAAHVRSLLANHLMDVPSTDRHTVKPWFAGKLDFSPDVEDLAPRGFPLIGGRLEYLDGRTVAALIYRRGQHTINVFTWPGASGEEAPKVESLQGYNVVRWRHGGMNWWAVSDLNGAELTEFARDEAGSAK